MGMHCMAIILQAKLPDGVVWPFYSEERGFKMKGCKLNGPSFVFCFVIGIFLLANPVLSAVICVETADQLQAALDTSASSDEDDIIKIEQGTYNGNFTYTSEKASALAIEGGIQIGV
jgi:hypothetical protein